ncbi:MAG: hypothetical protein IRZ02_09435 [Acidothermus sp.]|nr:hypothetical protein [Acidothermus sp.]
MTDPAVPFGGADPSGAPDRPTADDLPQTGVASVDAALRVLADIDRVPITDHPGRYERFHAELRGALDEVEDER